MKILQIISSLGKGGAERLVVDLCNKFSENDDIEIILCVYNEDNSAPNFKNEIIDKVKYVNLNKKKYSNLLFQFKIFNFLIKEKPDIINSHLSGTVMFLYLPILFLKSVKFFHTIHNLAEEELPSKFLRQIRKIIYSTNKLIPISISNTTQLSHTKIYGIDSKIIYNGVKRNDKTHEFELVKKEISSYKKNNETKVFLSVGRINSRDDQKNYKLLIEVFVKLRENNCNAILLIIGSDNSKDQRTIKNLLKLKKENVFLLGPKNNISDYMLNADFYCLSSKFEGLPITIIEALSFGLPVLSTNVGGINELITDNVNGLLVNNLNSDSYYNKLTELIEWDDVKLNKVRLNNNLKYSNNYSIEIASKNYFELYSQA